MKFRLFCALLFLPVIGYAAATLPIEFNGVLIQGGKTTVSLLNPNTGTAKWVAIGGKFDMYAVTSYIPDPKGADVVVLTKTGGTQTMRIVMKNSQIVASATVPGATVSAQEHLEVAGNLSQIMNAANQYFLQTGAISVTFNTLFAESRKPPAPVAGESYSGMVIKQGVEIRVSLRDGSTVFQLPP